MSDDPSPGPLEIRLAHTRTDHAKISVKYELRVGEALNAEKAGSSRCGRLRAFDEFETDLIRMRTREDMAIAKAKGKLRGKQPNLSGKQRKELWRLHDTGTG